MPRCAPRPAPPPPCPEPESRLQGGADASASCLSACFLGCTSVQVTLQHCLPAGAGVQAHLSPPGRSSRVMVSLSRSATSTFRAISASESAGRCTGGSPDSWPAAACLDSSTAAAAWGMPRALTAEQGRGKASQGYVKQRAPEGASHNAHLLLSTCHSTPIKIRSKQQGGSSHSPPVTVSASSSASGVWLPLAEPLPSQPLRLKPTEDRRPVKPSLASALKPVSSPPRVSARAWRSASLGKMAANGLGVRLTPCTSITRIASLASPVRLVVLARMPDWRMLRRLLPACAAVRSGWWWGGGGKRGGWSEQCMHTHAHMQMLHLPSLKWHLPSLKYMDSRRSVCTHLPARWRAAERRHCCPTRLLPWLRAARPCRCLRARPRLRARWCHSSAVQVPGPPMRVAWPEPSQLVHLAAAGGAA